MTKKQFQDLCVVTKNSIDPKIFLNDLMVNEWYNKYFKYYDIEKMQKVFNFIAEKGLEFTLKNSLDKTKEFYGYLWHEEVGYCQKIIKKAQEENIMVSEKHYPNLINKYRLPIAEVWSSLFNKGKEK